MADEETKRRTLLCDDDHGGPELREVILESLLQLHIDFRDLGCIAEAGPLLHTLMQLAYHAGAKGALSSPSQARPVLN